MRCARCGNDNPVENRFCGMCGGTLLSTAAPAIAETQTQRAASASPVLPAPVAVTAARPVERPADPPRASAPVSDREPVISGPSFLGLNDPAPRGSAPRKRASLSIDPHSASNSGGVDYLLDDDEPRRGGGGKFLLFMLALALAVGLGYLRWKNHGFAWLNAGANKPTAATQTTDTDTNSPAQGTTAEPQTAPATLPAAAAKPPETSSAPSGTATANPAPANPAPTSSAPANPAPDATTPAPVPSTSATKPDTSSAASKSTPAADANDDSDDDSAAAAPATKAEAAKPKLAPSKPSAAAPKPVSLGDAVAEAQKYLYGRGVSQDCDHGLRLLKPAANQANPKAMIQMGALYSAGLCTPRDLPTAYRWFALALRKDPDNMSVQTDLQKLWGEMTQPERQLAIKLSQ